MKLPSKRLKKKKALSESSVENGLEMSQSGS